MRVNKGEGQGGYKGVGQDKERGGVREIDEFLRVHNREVGIEGG